MAYEPTYNLGDPPCTQAPDNAAHLSCNIKVLSTPNLCPWWLQQSCGRSFDVTSVECAWHHLIIHQNSPHLKNLHRLWIAILSFWHNLEGWWLRNNQGLVMVSRAGESPDTHGCFHGFFIRSESQSASLGLPEEGDETPRGWKPFTVFVS